MGKSHKIEAKNKPSDAEEILEVVPKISFTVSMFSLKELKKAVSCCEPNSCLIKISSKTEWVNAKALLKVAICDLLFLQQAIVEDNRFDMTWSIPHIVTNALSLHTEVDYQQLVAKALKGKEPNVKISVKELPRIIPIRLVIVLRS